MDIYSPMHTTHISADTPNEYIDVDLLGQIQHNLKEGSLLEWIYVYFASVSSFHKIMM